VFRHPQVLDEFPGAVLGTLPVCVNDVGRRIRRIAVLNSGGAFQVLGVDDRDFRGRVGGGAESRGRTHSDRGPAKKSGAMTIGHTSPSRGSYLLAPEPFLCPALYLKSIGAHSFR
jgi:hypothetical protein